MRFLYDNYAITNIRKCEFNVLYGCVYIRVHANNLALLFLTRTAACIFRHVLIPRAAVDPLHTPT